jgi:hypothetical protein
MGECSTSLAKLQLRIPAEGTALGLEMSVIEADNPFAASGSNWWPHLSRSRPAPGAVAVRPEDLDTNNRVWASMKRVDHDAARANYCASPRPGAPSKMLSAVTRAAAMCTALAAIAQFGESHGG